MIFLPKRVHNERPKRTLPFFCEQLRLFGRKLRVRRMGSRTPFACVRIEWTAY